ncbi:hypothetical protein [Dyella amyloliquefaciens]|uniref:ApeI family dehydratase n=1 Tax=Dyella amyloliquefaciens TaxID=1770545 RepID=UPI00102E89B7|nr:hypothetical protein [Dyella amyloliquefaciens]
MKQVLPDHPWVAQVRWALAGAILLPTPEGLSALRRLGRRAFLQAVDKTLPTHGLNVPETWRLVDAWPLQSESDWAATLLAQPRPTEAELLGEQVDGDGATLSLRIPVDLQQFDTHFPQLPIVPGVLQLAWVLARSAERFGTPTTCRRVEMLKFQRPLRPGDEVQLSLRRDAAQARMHFHYARNEVEYSSGRLQWTRADE